MQGGECPELGRTGLAGGVLGGRRWMESPPCLQELAEWMVSGRTFASPGRHTGYSEDTAEDNVSPKPASPGDYSDDT